MDYHEAWLLAARTPGLGSVRVQKLLNHFGGIQHIFQQNHYPDHLGIPQKVQAALNGPDRNSITADLQWLETHPN